MVSPVHGNTDPNVQQPVVVVNRHTRKVEYMALYYYLAHFSKFVRPESVRLTVSGAQDGIRALAFRSPEGVLVLQLLNSRDRESTVSVGWKDQVLKASLPPLSIGTYQWSER
jgi:glucosylceramidase